MTLAERTTELSRIKIDAWKKALLDGSHSNPLLYFKSGRSKPLQLASLYINDIYATLIKKDALQKENSIPVKLTADLLGVKIPLLTGGDEKQTEDDVRTVLQAIKRLRQRAHEALNNHGLDVLYVAFGLLQWREIEHSEIVIQSPLVLVPVELKSCGSWSDDYTLSRLVNNPIVVNPTLIERMKRNFAIELPTITEDCTIDSGDGIEGTISDILEQVREAIKNKSFTNEWEVRPEMYLSLFTFQRQALYDDLDRHSELLQNHPLIRTLCGEDCLPQTNQPLIAAEHLDRDIHPRDQWQILDADASQQEAISAAKRGKSFVLHGPPGTGKSQTIANIIAECLAEGKRILFVSEKLAAIDVIYRRLADNGLAPFCLNLHARGTSKGEKNRVFDNIKLAFDQGTPDVRFAQHQWEQQTNRVDGTRRLLNDYVSALHMPRSLLHWKAVDVYGKIALLHALPSVGCPLPRVRDITSTQLDATCTIVRRLGSLIDQMAGSAKHPWRLSPLRQYTPALKGEITAYLQILHDHLAAMQTEAAEAQQLVGATNQYISAADIAPVLHIAQLASDSPQPPTTWLTPTHLEAIDMLIRQTMPHIERLYASSTALFATYHDGVLNEDHATLRETIIQKTAAVIPYLTPSVDTLLSDEAAWRATLTDGRSSLMQMREHGTALATLFGLAAPTTPDECDGLQTLGTALLNSPAPPHQWMIGDLTAIKKSAEQQRKHYEQCAEKRVEILQRYTTHFLQLDLAAIEAELRQDASLLRWFKTSWYHLRKNIRSCVQQSQNFPSYTQLLHDVVLGKELIETEARLAGEFDAQREHLGTCFDGATTDWEAVQQQLEWTGAFHGILAQWDWQCTPAMITLSAKSQRLRRSLEQGQQAIAVSWQAWETQRSIFVRQFGLATLGGPGCITLDTVPFQESLSQLDQIQAYCLPLWASAQTLKTHAVSRQPMTWDTLLTTMTHAQQVKDERAWLHEQSDRLSEILGIRFQGMSTDWARLQRDVAWCRQVIAAYHGTTPADAFLHLVTEGDASRRRHLGILVMSVSERLAHLPHLWQQCERYLSPTAFLADGEGPQTPVAIIHLRERIQAQITAIPLLERWLAYQSVKDECHKQGLDEFFVAIERLTSTGHLTIDASEMVQQIYKQRFYQLWLTEWLSDVPTLNTFSGATHEQHISEFRNADKALIDHAKHRLQHHLLRHRQTLLSILQDSKTHDDATRKALLALKHEVGLKRHKSLRSVIEVAGTGMLGLMPCWMMSPLSVSEYIDPRKLSFDLVIFDEASQICTEDAISSILRGKQLIVVGDEKQLPPTSAFRRNLIDETAEEDEEDAAIIERSESILMECKKVNIPERMLRFHYRSRHESLIAFSNHHFYNNNLTTFPSPAARHEDGVQFVYVADGVYDRGNSRTNSSEAVQVADLIFEHITLIPHSSLGVVAFSAAQQDAIQNEVDRRLKQCNDVVRDWFKEDKEDAFFIRNLESVQGDERDVIILSVGYGRDRLGKMTQNFGPLNSSGGERRLNVAITRSRQKMIVVTSIHAEDITSTSIGAAALRGYLDFAEHGPQTLATATPLQPKSNRFDSPFEQSVYDMLTARGLQVDT